MSELDLSTAPIVLDVGSGSVKVGFAGEKAPRAVFPSVVARPPHKMEATSPLVGKDAVAKQDSMALAYAVENGAVTNWDDWQKLVYHALKDTLQVAPEERTLLLCATALTAKPQAEKMTETVFETFNSPAYMLTSSAVLALAATGRKTGLVLSCGYGSTRVIPVYDGHLLPHGVEVASVGGSQLTDLLRKLLQQTGYTFAATATREFIRHVKETACFVSADFEADLQRAAGSSGLEYQLELPDGQPITIGAERFRTTEALFDLSILGVQGPGIHEMIARSISKCDAAIQGDLWGNIVLAGGSTMLKGLEERLNTELLKLSSTHPPKIVAHKDRMHLDWLGGATMATSEEFVRTFITKEDYDENGPSIVHRRTSL